MKKEINFEPYIDRKEIIEVNNTLKKKILSNGKTTKIFESKIAKFLNTKYVLACSSGTSALHISLLAYGVRATDEILLSSMSFIASANAVRYVGASPVFFDCDKYFNIKVDDVIDFLTNMTAFRNGFTINKKSKKKIKCIIVTHMWGNAVNLDNLYYICKQKNIIIIEDAAEAFGSRYITGKFKKKYCGTIGDIGCISFNGNKIITTGGGGAILCRNKKILKKCKYYINQAKKNNIDFIHDEIGYNYRLSDIQSAVGIAQIKKIKKILKLKNFIYQNYLKNFEKIKNFNIYKVPAHAYNNKWMICAEIINKKVSFLKVYNNLKKKNIFIRKIWYPIHLQKPYIKFQKYKIKNTFDMYKNSFCLPSYPSLQLKEIERIANFINQL